MGQALPKFRIDKGIGMYNANDYYAVLGLPVTANSVQIRKRYLEIAKSLHPDVFGRQAEEKEIATQYFSKLVSPAYNTLIQDRERGEYNALLKLIAKRLMKAGKPITPCSELSQKLTCCFTQSNYLDAVARIAEVQYTCLDKSLDYINQLSELNLIYVFYNEGGHAIASENLRNSSSGAYGTVANRKEPTQASSKTNAANYSGNSYQSDRGSSNTASGNMPHPPSPQTANNHIKVAETYIAQKQWMFALKELRTALQLDHSNSRCHALLGLVYMNQKLMGMAKVSFQQALKLNPHEPIALQNISKVNNANTQHDDHKKGGFFGWLG